MRFSAVAIVVLAIALAVVLDLKRARDIGATRREAFVVACAASAIIAPVLPLAAIVPTPVPAAGTTLASFDAAWPCIAPSRADIKPAAVALFLAARLLFPLGVVALARAHVRAVPRPRAFAAVAFAASAIVLGAGAVRVMRGGAELSAFRTCGALTPEAGAPREEVERTLERTMSAHAPALVVTASLDVQPTWARTGLPVAIADRTARLRSNGTRLAVADDDAAKAAVSFSTTPEAVSGIDDRGRPTVVLLDERAEGTFALRVGRPASLDDVGPLARAPRWPLAIIVVAATAFALSLRRRPHGTSTPTYRTAPQRPVGDVRPWLLGWILIEAASSALVILRPYA